MSASFLPLPLSLDLTQHTRWTATQENALQSYPAGGETDPEGDGEQQTHHTVVRAYLQFLWLPESIMPLLLFVPAIASASVALPSALPTDTHPLHAVLEPLIMAPRAASDKYYLDLPQILADGGGAGEIEENMMWFALSFEKSELNGAESGGEGESESEPWRDENWRKAWLDRMERREVQIQILLHFLMLALPGPKPTNEADTSSSSAARWRQRSYQAGKHRHQKVKPAKAPPLSTRDALEAYMDKMSMWQLMQGLEHPTGGVHSKNTHGNRPFTDKDKDERDWIQIFAEDIVEKQFRPYLPNLCDLFHEKVFPTSPISDVDDDDDGDDNGDGEVVDTRPNSPIQGEPASSLSRSASTSSSLKRKSEALEDGNRLSRSRSLSVSLQQERESQRDASVQQKSKKRTLNREVSMSRVFRAKSKGSTLGPQSADQAFGAAVGLAVLGAKEKQPSHGKTKTVGERQITLVQATPVANRIKSFSGGRVKPIMVPGSEDAGGGEGSIDVDVWESELPRSKDIIMGAGGTEEDVVLVSETPTKVKRARVTTRTLA
ncbi:hypothetical protein APHAL10511_008732 [Amanita phalloides]|nr:hypothetical protein APHAL10511_008732 [Amanita phalloides]